MRCRARHPFLSLALLVALSAWTGAPARGAPAGETDPVGVWPLQPTPEVVRGFDPPEVVYGSGHRGVDLLGLPGGRVHAALAGTVTFAGWLAGRGVVVVSHGRTRTTYEPVSATVEVGARVPRGATLGRLSPFGSHCLPRSCLHWGWLRGETYLDPLRLVGARPVRLLPLWGGEHARVPSVVLPVLPWVARLVGPWSTGSVRACGLRPASGPAAYARGWACW